jgi:hypothetical protein
MQYLFSFSTEIEGGTANQYELEKQLIDELKKLHFRYDASGQLVFKSEDKEETEKVIIESFMLAEKYLKKIYPDQNLEKVNYRFRLSSQPQYSKCEGKVERPEPDIDLKELMRKALKN